jgi:hypothetical protein
MLPATVAVSAFIKVGSNVQSKRKSMVMLEIHFLIPRQLLLLSLFFLVGLLLGSCAYACSLLLGE